MFLSFRGADVRNNFLSHLYASLVRSGIYVFRDDDALGRGENISSELLNAIEKSKIHLVVLSKDYVSSAWCLEELVHIIECRKRDTGQMVLPIFYNVEPSDVRRQKGPFGKSFDKHKSRYPESTLREWKEALTHVSNLSGFDSAQFMSVRSTPLFCPSYLKCFCF